SARRKHVVGGQLSVGGVPSTAVALQEAAGGLHDLYAAVPRHRVCGEVGRSATKDGTDDQCLVVPGERGSVVREAQKRTVAEQVVLHVRRIERLHPDVGRLQIIGDC